MMRVKVELYHEGGCLVEFQAEKQYPSEVMDWLATLSEAGFLVRPPEVEAGEEKQDVGFVVRRTFEKDGESCPVVDLYSANPRATFKVLKVYLNRDEDVTAFEKASGLALEGMPEYVGSGDIERGKSRQLDKFVVPAPRPFVVFMKPNPNWKEEDAKAAKEKNEVYKVAKKKFVRWGEASAKPAQAQEAKPKDDEGEYAAELLWWRHYLSKDPSVDDVTETYKSKVMSAKDKGLAAAIWNGPLEKWRTETGCEWDKEKKGFILPKDQGDENYGGPY